jgi:Uma2 family endonuclease
MATATLRLGPADHGRAMTLREYLDAEVEEGYRYELARGVLEVTNVPDQPHAIVVCNLYRAIARYEMAHPEVVFFFGGGSEYQFLMPAMISGRNPDFAVTLRGTPADGHGRNPASFAVEVVSEGVEAHHRDYVTKREEYLAYGLAEYWIVDPRHRRISILIRDGDDWSERVVKGRGSAASAVLPGFVVPLADLWAGVNG